VNPSAPRLQIVTAKIWKPEIEFGGAPLLESTIAELVVAGRG
jgi:hypothetical protein